MGRSRKTETKLQRRYHRQKSQPPQIQTPNLAAGAVDEAEISDGGGGTRFFGCYLLTSLSPRYKGHSYIGFTVNPKRRIRQHNGEITSGASRTKRKRPWEMVFCIHGFPTHVAALQFEWAWQHPRESLAVREAALSFKTLGGLANKIKLALTMLTLPSWQSMDLTVSFFSTTYMKHTAGCSSLPRQMKLHFCSMDELPCYWRGNHPYGCDDEDYINPNHAEDFGDLDDYRQVSSIDGMTQGSYYPTDVERFTIQNVSESITFDQSGLGGSLQKESSAMVGKATVEENEQILHSPTDVHTRNNTNKQVCVSKEISTQELIESFHRIDPSKKELPSHPFHQIDLSEKELASHPVVLEDDMVLSRQFLAGVLRSYGSNLNELIRHSKEMWTEGQRDSFALLEDLTEPSESSFDQVDPSKGDSSSAVIEKSSKKDDPAHTLNNESTKEQRCPASKQLPVRVRDDVRSSSSEGIEVIDLFTPSPECRIISGSKKRKVALDHPDIIDLTRSPLFVQL